MGQLPLELKKDNILFFERKIEENWNKAYNSYVLEVLQTTFLMLKFNKIKIFAKKIQIQPLPKDTDITNKTKKGQKTRGNFKLNNLLNMNLFNRRTITEPGEFEHIMRSLITLLEYDRTYPEAKRMLKELREGF